MNEQDTSWGWDFLREKATKHSKKRVCFRGFWETPTWEKKCAEKVAFGEREKSLVTRVSNIDGFQVYSAAAVTTPQKSQFHISLRFRGGAAPSQGLFLLDNNSTKTMRARAKLARTEVFQWRK